MYRREMIVGKVFIDQSSGTLLDRLHVGIVLFLVRTLPALFIHPFINWRESIDTANLIKLSAIKMGLNYRECVERRGAADQYCRNLTARHKRNKNTRGNEEDASLHSLDFISVGFHFISAFFFYEDVDGFIWNRPNIL